MVSLHFALLPSTSTAPIRTHLVHHFIDHPSSSFLANPPLQPCDTLSTHPAQAPEPTSKGSVPTHLPSDSSSSAPAPNPPCPAKSGSNSPTSSPAPPST